MNFTQLPEGETDKNHFFLTMTTYISLLRGINVGGHRKMSMSGLRSLYKSLGFSSVQTYIQSGNIVFSSPETEADRMTNAITNGIAREFGLEVPVIIRSAQAWKQVIANNPFVSLPIENLHVLFLSAHPSDEGPSCTQADEEKSGGKWQVAGKEIYLYCPRGFSQFKFPPALTEKGLGVNITARNWSTVMKLNELAEMAAEK